MPNKHYPEGFDPWRRSRCFLGIAHPSWVLRMTTPQLYIWTPCTPSRDWISFFISSLSLSQAPLLKSFWDSNRSNEEHALVHVWHTDRHNPEPQRASNNKACWIWPFNGQTHWRNLAQTQREERQDSSDRLIHHHRSGYHLTIPSGETLVLIICRSRWIVCKKGSFCFYVNACKFFSLSFPVSCE